MSSEIAIKVANLSKCYQIYDKPHDRLKQSLFPRLQTLVGRTPKRYHREFWALKDVSFEVKKGETVGVVGCNGSGKSTLLQIICGTLTPTGGTIETHGRIAALLELGSGFNPEFTGRENVYLNGAVLGLSQEEVGARFDDIAAFADIGQFIDQPVKTFSSGMFVRLAFAVQAMLDPEVFIVDEALAVGDERFQRKCFARIEELKSCGTAILFVSHSASTILAHCDHALLLERGERLRYGHPEDIIRSYQRLMYAPANEREQIIEKFRLQDQHSALPKTIVMPDEPQSTSYLLAHPGDDGEISYYDEGLIPETTLVYPAQKAEIAEILLLNEQLERINVLLPKKDYLITLKGKLIEDCYAVYFGLHIRSVDGVVVTGQRHPPEGQFIEQLNAGEIFSITFRFRMSLLPGCYFIGGGVWSNTEPSCLHRIIDSLMFRVIETSTIISFGYFDASVDNPILSISR